VKKATLERVQARLSEYVAASVKHPVLILRAGKPVAMLIGLDRKVHRTPTKLRVVLKRAWKDYENQGGVPHEEFWKALAEEVGKSQKRGQHDNTEENESLRRKRGSRP